MISSNDIHYMRSAINMGRRGIGRTGENPSVGCVIVKNDAIISRARTADNGRPHAESQALKLAGDRARGATLYVTLEPCAHHGNTPPCVDAILSSGVARVVVGLVDSDPRTAGQSIRKMKDAGIDVEINVLKEECEELHRGFISRVIKKRPFVTLKCACTLDGKIALSSGESKWITGSLARGHVHLNRLRHDAILVGVDTALHDNPMLTTRIDGVSHDVKRVILDRNLRINVDSKLVQSAEEFPVIVLYENGNPEPLLNAGVQAEKINCLDLVSVLEFLAESGVNNLFVEGGSKIHTAFLRADAFDELMIYRAPTILGASAKSVVSDMDIDTLSQRLDLMRIDTRQLGRDTFELYKRKD